MREKMTSWTIQITPRRGEGEERAEVGQEIGKVDVEAEVKAEVPPRQESGPRLVSASPAAVRVRPGVRLPGPGRRTPLLVAAAGLLVAAALLLPVLLVGRGDSSPPAPSPAAVPSDGTAVPRPHAGSPRPNAHAAASPKAAAALPPVSVYLSDTGQVEQLPLEDYIVGVVAAEMPADFELEALKAQSIAARTFIVRRLASGDHSGVPQRKADVTDTVQHQAYISQAGLAKWKEAGREKALAKIRQAVRETEGLIMTYQGTPITASFFSASGGATENSEDYWKQAIPYLRSVASPWDAKIDPGYKETVSFSADTFYKRLGIETPSVTTLGGNGELFRVITRTKGDSVKRISIAGQVFTGREVREKLGLRSSQFSIHSNKDKVEITTYGYGHGVGMSQWGANGMAAEGYKAKDILKHYYTGIDFKQASELL